jgi:hypothetical protein
MLVALPTLGLLAWWGELGDTARRTFSTVHSQRLFEYCIVKRNSEENERMDLFLLSFPHFKSSVFRLLLCIMKKAIF